MSAPRENPQGEPVNPPIKTYASAIDYVHERWAELQAMAKPGETIVVDPMTRRFTVETKEQDESVPPLKEYFAPDGFEKIRFTPEEADEEIMEMQVATIVFFAHPPEEKGAYGQTNEWTTYLLSDEGESVAFSIKPDLSIPYVNYILYGGHPGFVHLTYEAVPTNVAKKFTLKLHREAYVEDFIDAILEDKHESYMMDAAGATSRPWQYEFARIIPPGYAEEEELQLVFKSMKKLWPSGENLPLMDDYGCWYG